MTDVREVFEMSTKQIEPDLGAWNDQERRQQRATRNRKIGALVVAAAIGAVAVAVVIASREGARTTPADRQQPSLNPTPVDRSAIVATQGFVRAFGAFDGERAITYLSDFPTLRMDATTPEEVPTLTTFLKAMGYQQLTGHHGCSVTGTSDLGTGVRCPFEWHAIRSAEIGLGPYPGHWDFTVRDGQITFAALSWRLGKFSPQMWEPFREWVRQAYPKDVDVMYVDDGGNFSLTKRSTRLWEEHTQEYVDVARAAASAH